MGDAYLKEGMRIVLRKLGLDPDTPYSIEQVHANLWVSSAFRIKVENTDVSLFVKRHPDDIKRREYFHPWMFFANETAAYTHVISEFYKFQKQQGLEKPVELTPKCLYTMLDGNNDVIILEDLGVQGFYMPDRKKRLSVGNLTLLMKVLGKFHALSFAMKNQEPERFKELSSKVKETLFSEEFFEKVSDIVFLSFGKRVHNSFVDKLGPEYLKKLEKISLQNGNVLQETSRTDPGNEPWNVVNHGDLWSSNILLSADSSSLRFVDFQQTRYCSPAIDVSNVLFLCMDGPIRARHAEDLLYTYHKSLCDFMVELGSSPDIFPYSELKRQLIKYGRYGLSNSFLNIPHSMTESGGDLETDSETSVRDAVEKECSIFGDACLQLLLDNIKDAADMGYI